jgi:hypothetical protein
MLQFENRFLHLNVVGIVADRLRHPAATRPANRSLYQNLKERTVRTAWSNRYQTSVANVALGHIHQLFKRARPDWRHEAAMSPVVRVRHDLQAKATRHLGLVRFGIGTILRLARFTPA